MLKSIKQIAQSTLKCDFCSKELDLSKDRWLFQDNGSYIHVDCIEPSLEAYKKHLDDVCVGINFKLLSKIDPRKVFVEMDHQRQEVRLPPGIENWLETCEWCGHITTSPHETHICPEKI